MYVLLSIKPQYVELIFKGIKKYEFRKSIFKQKVKRAYIYATSPVKRIVGTFTILKVITGHPSELWRKYWQYAGIDEEEFFRYFGSCKKGFCIEIGEPQMFKQPLDPHEIIPDFVPPQSYRYLKLSLR